ncbi:phage tail protein [Vibrio jasicida]|uniref:Phage tail protein n=1 Tax=Vibrio jasicida TaxID=766224 RepID=A0ABW7JFG3_9VIBR
MSSIESNSISYMQELGNDIANYIDRVLGSSGKDKFDAYMTEGNMIPMFKDMGDGMLIGQFRYTAVFSIEDMPTTKIDPYVVMARVMAWITDYDREREQHNLKAPLVNIDAYNNGTLADMEITSEFVESITAKLAPDGETGDITFAGKEWNVQPYVVYVAEDGEVMPNDA